MKTQKMRKPKNTKKLKRTGGNNRFGPTVTQQRRSLDSKFDEYKNKYDDEYNDVYKACMNETWNSTDETYDSKNNKITDSDLTKKFVEKSKKCDSWKNYFTAKYKRFRNINPKGWFKWTRKNGAQDGAKDNPGLEFNKFNSNFPVHESSGDNIHFGDIS